MSQCFEQCEKDSDCAGYCTRCLPHPVLGYGCGRGCDPNTTYTHCVELSAWYTLYWIVNTTGGDEANYVLNVQITVADIAWVGFGLSDTATMGYGDFIIATANGSNLVVNDYFRVEYDEGLPELDTEIGGVNNILSFSSRVDKENKLTAVSWSRHLRTGDKFDYPITNNPIFILWAHGYLDSFGYHGPLTRGAASVNFFSGQVLSK